MSRSEDVLWCDGCGIEITWLPYRLPWISEQSRRDYCCEDCYVGLLCNCGERMEIDDERRESPGIMEGYF